MMNLAIYFFVFICAFTLQVQAADEPDQKPAQTSSPATDLVPEIKSEAKSEVNQQTAPEAQPQDLKFTIKQIIKSKKLLAVQSSDAVSFKPGHIFLVNFPEGKQCSLTLVEVNNKILTMDSTECDRSDDITLLSSVEASLISSPTNIRQAPEFDLQPSPKLPFGEKISVSIYYSTASDMTFDNASVTSTSGGGSISATYKTEGSVGLGINYAHMGTQSWGFIGSLLYEPNREVKSVAVSGPGGSFSGSITGVRPKISFLLIEGNAVYRWNSFYLPFGLNFSVPRIADAGTSVVDIRGAVGAYLGAGVLIDGKSAIEFFVRSIGMNMSSTSSSGSTVIDYQYGYISGFGMGYKYYF